MASRAGDASHCMLQVVRVVHLSRGVVVNLEPRFLLEWTLKTFACQTLPPHSWFLKGFGWAANPADVTGFANSESFPQIIEHMVNDPRMGTLVVASAGADAQARQVIRQRDRTDKGVVFLWTGSRDAKAGLAQLKHARIPVFYTPDKLARGLQSRPAYHTWRERRLADGFATAPPRAAPQDEAIARALGLGRPTLSESESKELLAAWGVRSARERRANSAEAAVEAAERLGFPVALKVDLPDIPHKTEAGVVRLNLGDAAQVRTAYAEILASAKAYAPQAQITNQPCRCRRWSEKV